MRKKPAAEPIPRSPALLELGRLLTLRDAAELLGISLRTVERMIVRRELRPIRIGHGRGSLRVAEVEIVRIISEGRERAERGY
jgi:excisionase family DNA binding protein